MTTGVVRGNYQSSCARKVRFTKKDAQRKASTMPGPRRVYRCTHCKWYHITTSLRDKSRAGVS